MTKLTKWDFEAIARQVYDTFLVSVPSIPVEGLFCSGNRYFIVAPDIKRQVHDGRTVAEWYRGSLAPAGMPIFLVSQRPDDSFELPVRSRKQISDDFGIVRTAPDLSRDIAVFLPVGFPLLSAGVRSEYLIVRVTRNLDERESAQLEHTIERCGIPLRYLVEVVDGATAAELCPATVSRERQRSHSLEILPSRRLPTGLSNRTRLAIEEDEGFWRDNYRSVFDGCLEPAVALGRSPSDVGEACLIGTTFQNQNIRSYFSLYRKVVIEMPLCENVERMLSSLAVKRRSFLELVARGHVTVVAPQSADRYDLGFVAELLEARPDAVLWSRRLGAAAVAHQVRANPLLVIPGSAEDRRAVLRSLARLADLSTDAAALPRALLRGLTRAWPYYEHTFHVRGAMASMTGPLACVAAEFARETRGGDYFLELASVAPLIEWATAMGLAYVPFDCESYTENGHATILTALQSGIDRRLPSANITTAREFSVAQNLLVVESDVDVVAFVEETHNGDLARVRAMVTEIAHPERSMEELDELVAMWNRQVRAYESRANYLSVASISGAVLGLAALAPGMPTPISISAVLMPVLADLVGAEVQRVGTERASVGALIDRMHAWRTGVASGAVLLARVRKHGKK